MRFEIASIFEKCKPKLHHFFLLLLGVIEKKKQTSTKSKKRNVISGILLTTALVISAYLLFSNFWFWVCWEITGAVLVARGCFCEWYLFKHPHSTSNIHHRASELKAIFAVAIGVTMELVSLGHSIPAARALDKQVVALDQTNLFLQKQVESERLRADTMERNVRELAHAYGQSSNALVEATNVLQSAKNQLVSTEAKLAEVRAMIRPLKERLIQLLNEIDPKIIPALRSGQTRFEGLIPENQYGRLKSLQSEPDADRYISGVDIETKRNVSGLFATGAAVLVLIQLKPALVQ